MTRIVKAPDVRRQELISIALRQFLVNGYEKTSIRSILKEAGGEIGMFYHYFKSKNEIYEAALENYNEQYVANIAEIVDAPAQSFDKKFKQIFTYMTDSLAEYRLMYSEKANPEIMTILLTKTLLRMVPLFELLIVDGLKENTVKAPVPNTHLLSEFILFGMSAIIHDHNVKSMEEKVSHIKMLLYKILSIKMEDIPLK